MMALMRTRRDTDPAVADRDPAPRLRWGYRRHRVARDDAPSGPTAGERAAGAAAGTAVLIARLVRLVAGVIALIIAAGILFVVLEANSGNTIVSHVHDWAKWLVGPFDGMFKLGSAKGTLALNWGLALLAYLIVGSLIARLVLAPARPLRRRTAA